MLDWYDKAEECARFHRNGPPKGAIDPNIPSMEAFCDSLAGLWCVYAWLLQELVPSSPSPPRSPDQTDSEVSKAKPPYLPPASPSSDDKFLSGAVIPANLFAVTHDHVQWSDVLAALKVATSCHLAGRRAWPWLARARITVLAAEAAGKSKTNPPPETDTNGHNMIASNLVLKATADAVAICREGISRVSAFPSANFAKSRKLLVPTSIQGIALPFFGQDNARMLCKEINHVYDLKRRVEKALLGQNGNAADIGAVMNGPCNGIVAQNAAKQSWEADDHPASTISAVHAVEWVCSGCTEHFPNKDALLSHKNRCPNNCKTSGGKEGEDFVDQAMHAADENFTAYPVARAPAIFSEDDAMDVLDYLVEIFSASKDDIKNMGGKVCRPVKLDTEGEDPTSSGNHAGMLANRPIFEGQVGLRCIHCRDEEGTSGAVFPSTVGDLPRAMWRLRVAHFERCAFLPNDCRARYEVMRNTVAPESTRSKSYWNEIADGLRLQDVSKGIMLPCSGSAVASSAAENGVARFAGSV